MTKQFKKWGLLLAALLLVIVSVLPDYGSAEESAPANAAETGQTAEEPAAAPAEADPAAPAGEEAAPAAAAAADSESKSLTPITAVKKALENSRYVMYVDEKTGNIRMVDKISKKEWLGSPQLDSKATSAVKKFTDSAVHIRYTEGADMTQNYPFKDSDFKAQVKINNDHVRVEFNFAKEKISLAMEYRLTDTGFEAKVPVDSIKEEGRARLTTIEPLPFFQVGAETDNGAMFLPDGSGALLEFRKNHPTYLRGYSEFIYGADPTFGRHYYGQIFDKNWALAPNPKESIALPVFGIYRNGQGYLAVVTEGETNAKINGTPAGVRALALYRASAEFYVRKDDVVMIGNNNAQIPFYQADLIQGDKTVQYILLEDQEANYVGMAKAYRSYLMNEKGVQPVVQEALPLQIHILAGILRDEVLGNTFMKMTTFEQIKEMIDAYAAKGISNIEFSIDGWSKDGLYGNQPENFPVEKKLGGSKGFQDLQKYAKDKGVTIYLKANYFRAYSDSDAISKNKDSVRGMNREVLRNTNYYVSELWNDDDQTFYLLKPGKIFENFVTKETKKFAELGVDGVQLKHVGNLLYSDQDNKKGTEREYTRDIYVQTLKDMKASVGKTAVEYGFAYTLGLVDRIDNAPTDYSHFIYTDKPVPFYQLALHGLVPYVASPYNLYHDSVRDALRNLEYGALPSFELTYAPTSDLQRTMETRLFTSEFKDWFDVSVEQYKEWTEVYGKILNQQMVNHEELQPNVFQTSYANGVKIIVNYNMDSVTAGGQVIQGQSYAVIGG